MWILGSFLQSNNFRLLVKLDLMQLLRILGYVLLQGPKKRKKKKKSLLFSGPAHYVLSLKYISCIQNIHTSHALVSSLKVCTPKSEKQLNLIWKILTFHRAGRKKAWIYSSSASALSCSVDSKPIPGTLGVRNPKET